MDLLYLKDDQQSGFIAYDNFVKYRRPNGTSISDYMVEFNLRYKKLKVYNMELPEGVLAYNLLACANLTDEQQQLCRATTPQMTYDSMKKTIEKVAIPSVSEQDPESRFQPMFLQDKEDALYNKWKMNKAKETPATNPQDEHGRPTTCSFCHSIYHWVNSCPDAPQSYKQNRGRRGRGNSRGYYRGDYRGHKPQRL